MTKAYLIGALHDGTVRKNTHRIAQKSYSYVALIAQAIKTMGGNAWVYREGKTRNVYIVEFSKTFLAQTSIQTLKEKAEFSRGYFDTDGGIAKQSQVRYYLYFCQKDRNDLEKVKSYLEEFGIMCGKLHNPSVKKDPNYWRFYISAKSYKVFAEKIGSSHPEKKQYLRMMI